MTGTKLESQFSGTVVRSAPGCPASARKDDKICAADKEHAKEALQKEKEEAAKQPYLTCRSTFTFTPNESCATKNGCWTCPTISEFKAAVAGGLDDKEYFSC